MGIAAWITSITAVLQMDARNPFDKLVIQTFGFSSSPSNPKSNVFLKRTNVWSEFKKIQKTGTLIILVRGEEIEEVHRLHSKDGKKIHEIELLAKANPMPEPKLMVNIGSHFDAGYTIGELISSKPESELFATLTLNDAKLLGVIPITESKTNQLLYQVSFKGSATTATLINS